MSKNKKESKKVINFRDPVYGNYTVNILRKRGHLTIKARTKTKTKEELVTLARMIKESKEWQRPLKGEFLLCKYPPCFNLFYHGSNSIERERGWYCSLSCSTKTYIYLRRLAKMWGFWVDRVKQAWDGIVLGKKRQKEDKLTREELLTFLLDTLRSPEIEYLTVSSADKLCNRKFGQKTLHPSTIYRNLEFLAKKMPDEIVVDSINYPQRRYFTVKKMAEIETEREGQRERTKERKEVSVVTPLPIPGKVVEPESESGKLSKIRFKCLKCKATMDKIPDSPATCPLCEETSAFITVGQ